MTPPTPPTTLTAPADDPGRSGERDWIDTAIEWTSGLAAVAMFAYGVALSYAVLYAIAEAAGLPPWARALWPGGWELFMASAALNALAEQRHLRGQHGWRRVPWYPLALTGLTAGGSILLNWFHPAIPLDPPPGWLVSLVYGLPPLEAVLAWHLFLLRIAHRRHPAPVPAGTVPAAVPHRAGPEAAGRDEPTGAAELPVPAGPPTVTGRRVPPPPPPAGGPAGPGRSRPAPTRPTVGTAVVRDAGLLAQARAAAAEHASTHGRPISRDALRQALRVSNRTAGALLRELRAGGTVADRQRDQADPHRQPTGQAGGLAVGAGKPSGGTQPAAVAGNGAGNPSAGLAALVPTVPAPGPAGDGQEGTGDA
jgi:hypothetical protein